MRHEINNQDLSDGNFFVIPGTNGEIVTQSELEMRPHAFRHLIEALLADDSLPQEKIDLLRGFLNSHSRQTSPDLPFGE